MPVSKKRKKDGKPVHRAAPADAVGEEHAAHPDAPKPGEAGPRHGRPTNPFVTQQARRASQRGR
jgi:hypothetical protein